MMLAAMSGIASTVPVTSRRAYSLLSAGAISGVCPIMAHPMRSHLRPRLCERELGPESGNRLELVERATGVTQAPARHHRDRDAAGRNQRCKDERHFVSHPAGRVLVHARRGPVSRTRAAPRRRAWRQ